MLGMARMMRALGPHVFASAAIEVPAAMEIIKASLFANPANAVTVDRFS